ncbi:MAG: hypothetical protein KGQ59_12520, partial [Bdellovibrionales bacterium]|nr:hypothetical protein [Bdellovibrionales bacterium]
AAYFEVIRSRAAALLSRIGAILMVVATLYLSWLNLRIGLASGWQLMLVSLVGAMGGVFWLVSFFRPRMGVWAALIFVTWLHSIGVTLGERDIAGLREFVTMNNHRHLVMFDPDRNIWHEVGLLSVAVGRPVTRISSSEEVLNTLDEGGAVILSEEQAQSVLPAVRELLDGEDDGREVVSTSWSRFPTRKALPVQQLIRAQTQLQLSRKFQILTLPPPSDRIMPEGGV